MTQFVKVRVLETGLTSKCLFDESVVDKSIARLVQFAGGDNFAVAIDGGDPNVALVRA